MNSNKLKWALMSLNELKPVTWTESQNRPKWALMSSKDPKYIQNDPIWTQNRPKWDQMSKPKSTEKSVNELRF